jgi:hypothetical protein
VTEESRRCHGMVSRPPSRSDDDASGGDSDEDVLFWFSFVYISPYYVKTFYISMKSIKFA